MKYIPTELAAKKKIEKHKAVNEKKKKLFHRGKVCMFAAALFTVHDHTLLVFATE